MIIHISYGQTIKVMTNLGEYEVKAEPMEQACSPNCDVLTVRKLPAVPARVECKEQSATAVVVHVTRTLSRERKKVEPVRLAA